VESPTAGLSTRPRDRALHEARSRRPLAWRARAMVDCGEPGGEGNVESPATGLSTRPRDRALHEARSRRPYPGEPAP
jgi:hypothetical protein